MLLLLLLVQCFNGYYYYDYDEEGHHELVDVVPDHVGSSNNQALAQDAMARRTHTSLAWAAQRPGQTPAQKWRVSWESIGQYGKNMGESSTNIGFTGNISINGGLPQKNMTGALVVGSGHALR